MSKGFTLIEILVAVSIIAIIAVIVIPNLRRYNEEQILRNAASQLAQHFRQAQSSSHSRIKCPDGTPSTSWGIKLTCTSLYEYIYDCQDPTTNTSVTLPTQTSDKFTLPPSVEMSDFMLCSPDDTVDLPVSIKFNNIKETVSFAESGANPSENNKKLQLQVKSTKSNVRLKAIITVNSGGSVDLKFTEGEVTSCG